MPRSIEQQIPKVVTTKLLPLRAKMRNVIFLATCFALVAIAFGNNLIIGRRQPGEILVKDEVIVRPRIWGRPQVANCNAEAPAGSEISFVSAVAWNPWIVSISPVKGGIGADNIEISAIGKPSWGFSIRCTVLAVPKKTTTARPTTTPKSTTQKTTTTETTTTETTTTEATTTETTTTEATTIENTTPTTTAETTTPETTTPETTTPETTIELCTSTSSPPSDETKPTTEDS